jgi:hypothetical protein
VFHAYFSPLFAGSALAAIELPALKSPFRAAARQRACARLNGRALVCKRVGHFLKKYVTSPKIALIFPTNKYYY